MIELIEQFGFSTAIATVVGGSIGFLLRSYFDHARNIEIEELRTQLGTLQHAQNTRFSRLHDDQAEAIKTLYGLIHDHRFSIATFLQSIHRGLDMKDQEACLMDVFSRSTVLYHYHIKNRILFTREVNAMIDRVERQQYDIPRPFFPDVNSSYVFSDTSQDMTEHSESFVNRYRRALEQLDKEFEILCAELDEAFRRVLGVS